MQSIYNQIEDRIRRMDRGAILFPDDFTDIGSSEAVRIALMRLCKVGVVIRVAHGIYCYPKIDTQWVSGIIQPSIEDIANAVAKRDKVRIMPTGAYVLNILGLSTQVPANVVFVTDGSARRISIGKGKGILFKHTSEMRSFAFKSEMMMMLVAALREIGQENVTAEQIAILKKHLQTISHEDYYHDIQLAPVWVRKTLAS
ncbi:MAG: DUF6088 family protein [Bacteroidales bacterium]|nr:DUF6088 family protein [Bacteroidales bacterium]